jgi:hypothetical protein
MVILRPPLVEMIRHGSPTRLREFAVRAATELWLRHLLEVDHSDEKSVIVEHGELLEPLATTILKEWTEEKLAEGHQRMANYCTAYRALLMQCRMTGVDAAFQQRSAARVEQPNPELDRLRLTLAELLAQNTLNTENDLNTENADQIIDTCRAIVELAKDADPLLSATTHGYWGLYLDRRLPEAVTHLAVAVESTELQAASPELFGGFLTVYCDTVLRPQQTESLEHAIKLVGTVRERSEKAGDLETEAVASLELVRLYHEAARKSCRQPRTGT